jgi:nicotinate-nucleotide pyrophosphorylase (carboxylating)
MKNIPPESGSLQAALSSVDMLISMALAEDLGERGDMTTQAISGDGNLKEAHADLIAKSAGVVAGLEIFVRVFQRAAPPVTVELLLQDGNAVAPRQKIAHLFGAAASILTSERTALNFLQRLSGIATLTRKFVEAAASTNAKILDTRKTTPGWRLLEKYAVRCGGGANHRFGLHDMFLVKENHIAAAGGITAAVRRCREFSRKYQRQWRLEVEARNLTDVEEAMRAGADQIMLDNMPLEAMRQAVQLVGGRVPLEASGNVTLANVRAIAETGVDFISIGALTHSAPAMDFSLLIR